MKEWSYIRREGDVREELFHLGDDPRSSATVADPASVNDRSSKMRALLDHLTAGPLLPQRFSR